MRFDPLELVGEYFHRLAMSYWTLELSDRGRFSCSRGACLGETCRLGTWELEGDTVVLRPEAPRLMQRGTAAPVCVLPGV